MQFQDDRHYAGISTRQPGRLFGWLGRVPCAILAALMTAIAQSAQRYEGSRSIEPYWLQCWLFSFLLALGLLMPGALRRINAQQVLILTLVSLPLSFGHTALGQGWLAIPYLYNTWLMVLLPLFCVGACEWFLTGNRDRARLRWLLLLLAATACLVTLIVFWLDLSAARLSLNGGERTLQWLPLLEPFLIAISVWLVVPAALGVSVPVRRTRRICMLTVAVSPIIAFVLFIHVLIYPVAQRSLITGFPFHRAHSLWLLHWRHSDTDIEAIYTAISQADWLAPSLGDFGSDGMPDYRVLCVESLHQHDPVRAADVLSQHLGAHPSPLLAGVAAPLLAEQHRYETTPLLMRYGCLLGFYELQQDGPCAKALAEMGVPSAAFPMLAIAQARGSRPLSEPARKRLVRLLGTDAGADLEPWFNVYDAIVGTRPTPLSPELARDTGKTLDLILDYHRASNCARWAASTLAARRIAPPGQAEATQAQLDHDWQLRERFYDARRNALNELWIAPPDLNVPSVTQLEREIRRYQQDLDSRLVAHGIVVSPATPTTSLSHN